MDYRIEEKKLCLSSHQKSGSDLLWSIHRDKWALLYWAVISLFGKLEMIAIQFRNSLRALSNSENVLK